MRRLSPFLLVLGSACAGRTSFPASCCDSSWQRNGAPRSWTFVSSAPQQYQSGTTAVGTHGGHGAVVIATADTTGSVGGFTQVVLAERFRGRRVRLSGWTRHTALANRAAGLWLRAAAPGDADMRTLLARTIGIPSRANAFGWTQWEREEIVMDVPLHATTLTLGVVLLGGQRGANPGPGTRELVADDVTLEIVDAQSAPLGEHVPAVDAIAAVMGSQPVFAAPANLDFEGP